MSNTEKNPNPEAQSADESFMPDFLNHSVTGGAEEVRPSAAIAAEMGGAVAPDLDPASTLVEAQATYEDSTISDADLPAILRRVNDGQANAKTQFLNLEKQRGKTSMDLSKQLSEAFVTIQKLRHNCSPTTIAQVFASFGVKPAGGSVSQFTPWINILFAEKVEGKTVTNALGQKVQKWAVNANYSRYFHVYELMEREGVTSGHAKFIDDRGGASTIVKKALKAASDAKKKEQEAEKPTKEQVAERVSLYVQEVERAELHLPWEMGDEVGEFVTILCQRIGDRVYALDVIDEDATFDLEHRALDLYDELARSVAERERDQRIRDEVREEERAKLLAEPSLLAQAIANRPQD